MIKALKNWMQEWREAYHNWACIPYYGPPQMTLAEWTQKYDIYDEKRDYSAECQDRTLAMLADYMSCVIAVQGRYRDKSSIGAVQSAINAYETYKRSKSR